VPATGVNAVLRVDVGLALALTDALALALTDALADALTEALAVAVDVDVDVAVDVDVDVAVDVDVDVDVAIGVVAVGVLQVKPMHVESVWRALPADLPRAITTSTSAAPIPTMISAYSTAEAPRSVRVRLRSQVMMSSSWGGFVQFRCDK